MRLKAILYLNAFIVGSILLKYLFVLSNNSFIPFAQAQLVA